MTLAIHQLLSRYQRHLTLRTALLIGLGVGCLVALSWRLWLLGMSPWMVCAVGVAAVGGLAWWQRRALRQMWAARTQTSLALDRVLGLEARLITAEEFANVSEPPALYARLMEDPALVHSLSSMRLSPIADRRTILLAVVLLALLFWPWRVDAPPQLAKLPPSSSTPPEIPPPTPPPQTGQSQSQTSQRQQSGSQQQQAGGSGEASQSQQAGKDQRGKDQAGTSSDRTPSESDRGEQGPSPQSQAGSQQSAQQAKETKQQQANAAGQQPGKDAQEQASKTGRQGSAASQQGAEQAKAGQEKVGRRVAQNGSGVQPLTAAQEGAIKADIQQMLQQLSTELKQLQAELQQQHANEPAPAPGTSTDPDLFDDASRLAPPTGGPLPIHLDVDTEPTSTTRKGGGVGEPSGEAAEAPFQVQPESVGLADSTTEAPASQRQAIPPEYRPVFERLSQTRQQPTP